jgi:hypothetical protein
MRFNFRVTTVDGRLLRNGTLDAAISDPLACATPREVAELIGQLLFESHDLNVAVTVDGGRLEIQTAHARVVADAPARFDSNTVAAALSALGLGG